MPCRYRSLAGHSLRALRLDLALAVLHHLQDLPSNNWACEEEEASEVNPRCPCVLRLLVPRLQTHLKLPDCLHLDKQVKETAVSYILGCSSTRVKFIQH